MLLQTCVAAKETSTATAECRTFYALFVIDTFVLHTRWTTIWVISTTVFSVIIIGFKTAITEITCRKESWESRDDVIMLAAVQKDQLFVLGRTKPGDFVTSRFVDQN